MTVTMMKANVQPPPLFLPGSAFFPSSADWGNFDDDSSIDSMSSISTTCEAAEDMRTFAATFDQTVVVYLFDNQQCDCGGCNALQPHHAGVEKDVITQKIFDTFDTLLTVLLLSRGVTAQTALLLMSQLEQYNHDEIEKNIIPSSKELVPWQGNNHHCSHDHDSLPTFQVLDDDNKIAADEADCAPLPTFLVQPREGLLLPATKRARVTPMSSPFRGDSEIIPPLYISVPNPLNHDD